MDDTATARFGIHLPAVDPRDSDEVIEHIIAASDGLPEISLHVSRNEAERAADDLQGRSGPISHWETLRLMIAVDETLFDDEVTAFSPAFHAKLVIMLQFPAVPEAAATQIAFGRHIGEAALRKIEKLAATAETFGRSVDEHVAVLASQGEIEHDLTVRCFLGETREVPDQMRMRRALELFRITAALCPEPFRPPILCVIAWMLWALDKRPLALAHLRAAAEIDPEHPLSAGLALHMRTQQPEWIVRRRGSSLQPDDCT